MLLRLIIFYKYKNKMFILLGKTSFFTQKKIDFFGPPMSNGNSMPSFFKLKFKKQNKDVYDYRCR